MSTANYLNYFSACVFGGSVLLIIYLVYYEWKQARIESEEDEIEMGELKNEGIIESLSDAELVDMANQQSSSTVPSTSKNGVTPKKPTG
jgi:hypothetical protein